MPLNAYLAGFRPPPDPAVLTDATGWSADPEFWPAYLVVAGGSTAAWTTCSSRPVPRR